MLYEYRHRNEYDINTLTSIYWRASLVPAAAVIPAPIAYTKVVAVKKLVVGSETVGRGPQMSCTSCSGLICWLVCSALY